MSNISFVLNGTSLTAEEGTTILEAARAADIDIPTLCFLKDCNPKAVACRVCLVKVSGKDNLMPACATKITEGMEIITDSPEIEAARTESLESLCANHFFECDFCPRYSDCEFYKMMIRFGINENHLKYPNAFVPEEADRSDELVVCDPSKCINCRRCVGACENIVGIEEPLKERAKEGERTCTLLAAALKEKGEEFPGQCIAVCPTGALSERNGTRWVFNANKAKDVYSVAIVSPYAAGAFGEELYFRAGDKNSMKKVAHMLKDMHFDAVYDESAGINTAAKELAEQLKESDEMVIAGTCPSFNRFVKKNYPQYAVNEGVTTAFAAKVREAAADDAGEKEVYVTVIRSGVEERISEYEGIIDSIMTTNELASMWKKACVSRFTARELWKTMPDGEFDQIPGTESISVPIRSGILGMALKQIDSEAEFGDFDENGISTAVYSVNGLTKRAAYVAGMGNARRLMKKIAAGEESFDVIEVMSSPGGWLTGCGQPRMTSASYSVFGSAGREQALLG